MTSTLTLRSLCCSGASQEMSIKLHDLAKTLAEEMPTLADMEANARSRIDHFLMTLTGADA